MLTDGGADALATAINRNTDELRKLREALCGKQVTERPGGAIGQLVDTVVAEAFHGRAGRPQ